MSSAQRLFPEEFQYLLESSRKDPYESRYWHFYSLHDCGVSANSMWQTLSRRSGCLQFVNLESHTLNEHTSVCLIFPDRFLYFLESSLKEVSLEYLTISGISLRDKKFALKVYKYFIGVKVGEGQVDSITDQLPSMVRSRSLWQTLSRRSGWDVM